MSSKNKLNRRNALGLIAGGIMVPVVFDPLKMLVNGILEGIVLKAQAAENPHALLPRKYFHISMPGGPPRWIFDLPLTPYRNKTVAPNQKVATSLVKNQLQYQTKEINLSGKKIYMPQLWGGSIPTTGEGPVAMQELLKNMMIFRGVDLIDDGHENNSIKQLKATAQSLSLHGIVAENSNLSIPSVTLNNQTLDSAYRSRSGIGNVKSSSNLDGLKFILDPFNRGTMDSKYVSRRVAMESTIDHALSVLGQFSKSGHPGSDGLYRMTSHAESMLRKGIGDASVTYNALKSKYYNLILATREFHIQGLTDQKISTALSEPHYKINDQVNLSKGNYLLGEVLKSAEIRSLAEGFAIAEYLFKNNLSSSVAISIGSVFNLLDPVKGSSFSWVNDEHSGGVLGSTLAFSFFYKAVSACIYEFSRTLGPEGFKETVIHLTSEFNRSARNDGSGSDHGFRGHCVSLFSGVLTEPLVFGETKEVPTGTYKGEWGLSETVPSLGRPLHIEDVASTVAELARIESPTPQVRSLVRVDPNTSQVQKQIDESEKG